MRVYRFCSSREAQLIKAGCSLVNLTDHYRNGRGGSTSLGFCLTADEPKKAWKYLKGIVTPHVCCIYDIPGYCLISSTGKYAVGMTERNGETFVKLAYKREWCTTFLMNKWLVGMLPLELFMDPIELHAARIYSKYGYRNYY